MQLAAVLRIALYCRQSHGSPKSIDQQFVECDKDVKAEGWPVGVRYSDKVSASRFSSKVRGGWESLIADIEARRVDVLVLWESSRGDRDAETWLGLLRRCRDTKTQIRVTSDDRTYRPWIAIDWKTLADAGIDNHMESEKTSKRVRRHLAAAAEQGRPHGRVKYGYERIYDINEKGLRVLREQRAHVDRAPVVVEIVKRVGKGDPIVTIREDLNKRGIPGPTGGLWNDKAVREIATSRTYLGSRVHRAGGSDAAAVYPGMWPRIVEDSDHLAAARVLSDPARTTTRPGRQKWLLSYLADCDVCSAHLHRVPMRTAVARQDRYHCIKGCTGVQASGLDDFISELLCRHLAEPGQLDLYVGDDAAVIAAREEEARLLKELDDWRDSAAAGETTRQSLARIEAGLSKRIADAQRTAVTSTVPAALLGLFDAGERYEAIRDRFDGPDGLLVPARREVIKLVMNIRVQRAPAGKAAPHGFDFHRLGQSRWLRGDTRPWSQIWAGEVA
jgi:DNA invertase Pin-like site-specific DNA recombinase